MKYIESEDENIKMFNYMKVFFFFLLRLLLLLFDLFDDKFLYKFKFFDIDDKFLWDFVEMFLVFFVVYLLYFFIKSCVFLNG